MENKSETQSESKSEQTGPDIGPEHIQAVGDWQAAMQNSAIMHQIVREMKEIAELPSETPKDVHPLERVEFPDKGGVLTYMGGYAYPYKGFPFFEFVDKIDAMKKMQRGILSSLFHALKARKWKILLIPWLLTDIASALIYPFYRMVERFRLKPERYCDAMRELHRTFSLSQNETRLQLRDIACMLLEMDNAYRFRFQDIIVELDKEKLRKRPSREVLRLLRLMQDREKTQEVKDTWKLVQYFVPLYLIINRSFRKALVEVLGELDLEKVALSVEDKHFCEKRLDYQFDFMQCQQLTSS